MTKLTKAPEGLDDFSERAEQAAKRIYKGDARQDCGNRAGFVSGAIWARTYLSGYFANPNIAAELDSLRGLLSIATDRKQLADALGKIGFVEATLSLPAGGVAVSDAMAVAVYDELRRRLTLHPSLSQVKAALEAALSPEAKTGERS